MKIILASLSPRRKSLLQQMGLVFEVVPSNFKEQVDSNRPPDQVAKELAFGKAMAVARQNPDALVIGSDTIVTVNGKQLEKPLDRPDATRMLGLLGGQANTVTTGIVVIGLSAGIELVESDSTTVYFRPYNKQLIDEYVATGDPLDKAGAYGIQSGAAPLISHIEGYYDTVVGLPTNLLSKMLASLGVSATPVTLESPL